MNKEHNAMSGSASPADGGEHKKGSARAYYEASDPTTRPDGVTLTSADDGRLYVDSDNQVLKVYDGTEFLDVNTSLTVTGQTDITAAMDTSAGWTNSTGGTVMVVTQAVSGSSEQHKLKIDYGSGLLTVAISRVDFGGQHSFITLLVPNNGVLKYDLSGICVLANYQSFS